MKEQGRLEVLKSVKFAQDLDSEQEEIQQQKAKQSKKVVKVAANNWSQIIKESRGVKSTEEQKTQIDNKETKPEPKPAAGGGGFFLDFGAAPSESFSKPEQSEVPKDVKVGKTSAKGSETPKKEEKKGKKTKDDIEAEIKARIEKKERKRQEKLEAKKKKREEEKPTEPVSFEELPRKL